MTQATLLRGIDRATFAAALAGALRRAGLDAPLSATERFAAALTVAGPMTRVDLYWLARISFVTRHEQIPLFDRVFAIIFDVDAEHAPRDRQRHTPLATPDDDRFRSVRVHLHGADEQGAGLPWATRPSVVGRAEPDPDAVALPELLAAADPGLSDKPFDLLDEDELRIVGAQLEASFSHWPERRSRRHRYGHRGAKIAYRPTLRRALRTGGEPLDLVHLRPRTRPRRVIALVDVSGSMESFARGYMHVMRALAVAGRAEVFAFATELTRITPMLRHHSASEAIDRTSDAVGDRFGGTRLASSLGHLLGNQIWSSQLRGGVVLIVSDGCDTDPPELLRTRMARLHRLAHRIVWVNPRLAAPDYEPLVRGMVAAIPYCDRLLPGDSMRAIDDVVAAIVED